MKALALALPLLIAISAKADPVPPSWDEDRLAGFAEHKVAEKIHDRERLKGRLADTEEREQWERERKAALAEHKRRAKTQSPQEGGPEEREYLSMEKRRRAESEKIRAEYSRHKAVVEKRSGHGKHLVSEAEELGLNEKRPRYTPSNRVLYGAKAKFKPGAPGSGGSSGSYGGGGGGGNNSNFPPPPSFDDFPPGDGYVPPPPIDDYSPGDFPPPPPIDPGDMGHTDFPPPPPPPDFGDFPPPPMPPEGF